jgi:hypothetical protein
MVECEILLPPFCLSNVMLPLVSNITICETLSSGIGESSSIDFLDVELPSDEAILEDMVMDF